MRGRLPVLVLLLTAVAALPPGAMAQSADTRLLSVSTTQDAREMGDAFITFRFDDARVDPGYMDNRSQLENLASLVERFRMNIDSVTVIAFASPEGRYSYNRKLSSRRARSMRDYLVRKWPDVKFGKIREFAGGPDFDGLTKALSEDPNLPFRDEVTALAAHWGANPDATFRRLMELHDGEPYAYISEKYLPWLRNATTVIFHYDRATSLYEETDTVVVSVTSHEAVDNRPAEDAISAAARTSDTVDVVSVYVAPKRADGSSVVKIAGDTTVVLPPAAGSAAGVLPPTVNGQAGILPPGVSDTTAVQSVAVIPASVKRYVVDDPVAVTPVVSGAKAGDKAGTKTGTDTDTNTKTDTRTEAKTGTGEAATVPAKQDTVRHETTQQNVTDEDSGRGRRVREPREPRQPRVREPRQPREPRHYERTVLTERPIGGISTNVLFDAITALNIGVEIPFGRQWDLHGEFIFPWWSWNNGSRAFQVNHGSLALRRWFNPAHFDGWYLSFIAGGGRYDLQFTKDGWRGYEFMGGFGCGYSLPLSQNWVLDMGLGLGAMYTRTDQYEEYQPGARVIVNADRNLLLLGPTDLHISLIYLFYPW